MCIGSCVLTRVQGMLAHMQEHFATTNAGLGDVGGAGRAVGGILRGLRQPPGQVWSLRHAAATYAAHGWAVVPGGYTAGGAPASTRQPGRASLHPVPEHWQHAATTDIMQVARWWARQPWIILLPTGPDLQVVEMPAGLGQRTADRLGGAAGPIAVEAGQRWLMFCRPQPDLTQTAPVSTSEEESRAGLLLHTSGSWVPVPPIGRTRDRLSWLRPPWTVGWRLPDTADIVTAARSCDSYRCPGVELSAVAGR